MPHSAVSESEALVMTQFDATIDTMQGRHNSTWTGMCGTCDLIWPCPPVRAKLSALFAIDEEAAHDRFIAQGGIVMRP